MTSTNISAIELVLFIMHMVGFIEWGVMAAIVLSGTRQLWDREDVHDFVRYAFLGGSVLLVLMTLSQLEGLIIVIAAMFSPPPLRQALQTAQLVSAGAFLLYQIIGFIVGLVLLFWLKPKMWASLAEAAAPAPLLESPAPVLEEGDQA
jgi:apolipoprotein N-acyltransferase